MRLEMDSSYVGGDHSAGHQLNNARKRAVEDAFEVQSNISNHFKKLRLNNAPSQIYTAERSRAQSSAAERTDLMPVDDTPSKVYIHDIEAEIAQIEAEEPQDMYLLDIDKKVTALPTQLLQNGTSNRDTQLVLYREPSSISIPAEQDVVRWAIIEARRRVRERQKAERENGKEQEGIHGNSTIWPEGREAKEETQVNGRHTVHGIGTHAIVDNAESDVDLMDID